MIGEEDGNTGALTLGKYILAGYILAVYNANSCLWHWLSHPCLTNKQTVQSTQCEQLVDPCLPGTVQTLIV